MNLDEAKQITKLMLEKNVSRAEVIKATERDPMSFSLLCKDAKAIIAFLLGEGKQTEAPVENVESTDKE